ncbi:glycosyltransferase family 4 protein [Enterobacter cloacae]|uniref:glycosyltransferase family 4 protein n=1 Tax=Enterobacter cloacae TaxID=550 RepID=UPI0020048922|nr:glycosyltransferase family 1 protein [Enterobacter cloacae]MCK6718079.1 glycosyltransferase family 4 protein [Enterobacter cloacae]HBN5340578.1 glycosyltransferase family 4 protein [Enterobacter cloacae]
MKLTIDGIIENLQNGGGCTVYFEQLLSYYQKDHNKLNYIRYNDSYKNITLTGTDTILYHRKQRIQERWRDVDTTGIDHDAIFHSTHYRLPLNKKQSRIVTTVHDFTYELFRKGPAQWMHTWQKNRAINNSDLVICVSHNTANDLLKFCPISEKKIRVVHNGVSEKYYPIDNITKTNEVLFVGARDGYKNFSMAVDALSLSPSLVLSIVGGGKLTSEEIALLESKIPGRYEHLGRVSDEELNGIYNRVYCLLYPSLYEGFGIPVIEAMRCGCVVIAVNVSSIPEVAGNAAILLDNPHPVAIAHALKDLENTTIYDQLRNDGFNQAKKFSWEKCYKDTLSVYKECLK